MTAPHYHAHVDDPVAVGQRLKEARVAAGLSQRSLSLPGCSSAYISRLEAGDRVPSLQLLRRLALKLGIDEEYLARGVERVEQAPPELVEGEVARRLGELRLARERYQAVLATGSGRTARAQAAERLGQLRDEARADEERREVVPGGLEDPRERAGALWRHSRLLLDQGDRTGAARYARDALALLDFADDRELAAQDGGLQHQDREFAGA